MITTSAPAVRAPGRLAVVAALAALAACGGRYRAGPAPAAHATAPDAPPTVADAALPFAIVDGRTGREVAIADFWAAIAGARAVCAGETHPSPHDHWAQLQVLDHMSAPPATGLALGLEMIEAPFQGVLADWSASRIDEAALLSRTGWADRWNIDFALYRPMLELARARGAAVVGLNAPSELVARVAEVGVDGLAPADGARLPALELADAQHRAWFDRIMAALAAEHGGAHHGHGHGGGHASGDNVYAAQVVRDEWMADVAARWLAGGSRMLVLAGTGHCHDSAIVRRLVRRGVTGVVSVHPIVDDGQGNVAAALAEGINDFLFVMTPAPRS